MFGDLQTIFTETVAQLPPLLLVLGVAAAAVSVVLTFAKPRAGLLLVGAMVFASSIGVANFDDQFTRMQLLYPIQNARTELFAALGLLLTIGVSAHIGLHASRRIPVQGLLILLIAILASALRTYHEGPASGVSSFVMALITIGPVLVLIPRIIDDWDDIVILLRFLMVINAAWIGFTALQIAVDPSALVVGPDRRFFAITANPQAAAIYMGVSAALLTWLFANDWRTSLKFLYGLLAGANALGVLWTGSRTGLVLMIIGLCVVAYGRLGRSILFLPLAAIGVNVGWWILGVLGITIDAASRVTSTDDTRSAAWLELLGLFQQSPALGVGVENLTQTENSYLYALAAYGVSMGFMVILLALVSLGVCLRLFRLRMRLAPQRRSLVDVVLAFNAMYFIGGLAEGYIMARVSVMLGLMIVFAALASRIGELAEEELAAGAFRPASHGDDPDDDDVIEPASDAGAEDPWPHPSGRARIRPATPGS